MRDYVLNILTGTEKMSRNERMARLTQLRYSTLRNHSVHLLAFVYLQNLAM